MSSGEPQLNDAEGPDWEGIGRCLAGKGTPADREAMRQWLAAHPADDQFVSTLNAAVERLSANSPDAEAALAAFRRGRSSSRALYHERGVQRVPRSRSILTIAIAASMLIACTLALWRLLARGRAAPEVASMTRTVETQPGKRDSVTLADGSRVLLGPGSRISIRDGFNSAMREVDVNGNAFFDVVSDARRPFIVRAGAGAIRVVGTSFTVQTHAGGAVRVVVSSGVVTLTADSYPARAATLRAGDEGTLHADGQVLMERVNLLDETDARRRGWEKVRDAPLSDVAVVIRRWYALELRVADSALAKRRLSATFTGAPVDQLLNMLALTLGAQAKLEGNSIVLQSTPSGSRAR